jgi:4'-phosphopantetheinyl transferase
MYGLPRSRREGPLARRPEAGEVHVWTVDAARRFGSDPGDAAHRDAARAVAHTILAGYLATMSAQLRFDIADFGKPRLGSGFDRTGLRFNISYATQRLLLAVSTGVELGVDVERCRPVRHAARLAARYFPADEYRRYRDLPPERRPEGFISGWTRTEALAKAQGTGIFRAGRPPAPMPTGSGTAWSLHDLDAGRGYRAALAVAGSGHDVGTLRMEWKHDTHDMGFPTVNASVRYDEEWFSHSGGPEPPWPVLSQGPETRQETKRSVP